MSELIDKSPVVTEIKRRISNHNKELKHASDEDFVSSWTSDEENQKLALTALIPFINTLEVKEVDLEQEIHKWIEDNTCRGYCSADVRETAEHFFELGLRMKGE